MVTRKSDQPPRPTRSPGSGDAPGDRLRLSLKQLEVFVATARAGSTRRAADRVARSQSAASAALTELEQALGAPLFDRVRRRLVLNENGRALLPKAAALLDHATDIQQLFAGVAVAPLNVAASLTIGEVLLPALVARWKAEHPGCPVHLAVDNTQGVIDAVAHFRADLGFIEGSMTHPELLLQPWLEDEMLVVAGVQHPLAHTRRVSLQALREQSWALRERGSGTREAVDRWLFEHLGAFDVAYEFGSTEALKRLVAAGTAVGCMSRLAASDAIEAGQLVALKTTLPPARRRLAIVTHRDKHLGRGTEEFIELCRRAG